MKLADTSAIWQRAAHTTYQLSSPSCSTGAISRDLTPNKICEFWGKSQKNKNNHNHLSVIIFLLMIHCPVFFFRDKTQHANFRGNPLYYATNRHLNNN